ncbi:hypothetical protein Q4595_16335 [Wenyingzhuangia sp. 1_MG-2023]|nr:hypothetical protein [Wenyingzhuangia sp. 1_MG-2023]
MKIADIKTSKNGIKTVTFFKLGIYTIIKDFLGFRYTQINGKGMYLRYEKGSYRVSNFIELKDSITEYLKTNFENLEINGDIDFENFINNFYHQRPIRKGDFSRDFLSENFELTENNSEIL